MWWRKWCAWSFLLIKNLMTLHHHLSLPKLISSFSQTHQTNFNSDYKPCAALPKKGKVTEHPEIPPVLLHRARAQPQTPPLGILLAGSHLMDSCTCMHTLQLLPQTTSDQSLRCGTGGLMKLSDLLCWRESEDHTELHLFYITQVFRQPTWHQNAAGLC